MVKNVPFPRLYHCRVPRQEYIELIEVSNTVFADLYLGFDSFHSLFVSVNAAGQIVIHGEGVVNDKALLERAACVDFIWDHGEQSLFIAHLNRMAHLTSGRRLLSRKERLRVLSIQWGERGLEYSFYVHDEDSMQWNFVEQSIPYIVSITTTNPVDVVEEHQSDSQDINLLRLAYISGYFESPRRLSLTELGQRAGLSSNSVNRRLRRIIAELVGERIDP